MSSLSFKSKLSPSSVSGDLFPSTQTAPEAAEYSPSKQVERLARLDVDTALRARVLPFCRLKPGEVWSDEVGGHRVGVIDACNSAAVDALVSAVPIDLAVNDPPYNIRLANKSTHALFEIDESDFDKFSAAWIANCIPQLAPDSSFYCWLGANYKRGFHPIPEIIVLLRSHTELTSRNWITVRNQRGYGTQNNWMWVRQELLYYTKGRPFFDVGAEYTDIPKVLRGYYKKVNGQVTENLERSKSENIRAGNVWIDIQQVFYRLEENVPGCYAQKPLKSIERILSASSKMGDTVLDLFAHSGTTLLAGERLGRRVITCDIDPVYAEISIRRLERYRSTSKTGWQWNSPFPELDYDSSNARKSS
ncbi:MAG: DNA-methyltransferase [Candidatus Binataceae bacterium]